MAVCFEDHSTNDDYLRLRREAAVLHAVEFPLEFRGPDAGRLLDRLVTKDITKVKPMRCGYGLACYEDGGILVDSILLRQAKDRFCHAQADRDFCSWARAQGAGMDMEIIDPNVLVSQIQGQNELKILEAAAKALPEKLSYFAIARVNIGGRTLWSLAPATRMVWV